MLGTNYNDYQELTRIWQIHQSRIKLYEDERERLATCFTKQIQDKLGFWGMQAHRKTVAQLAFDYNIYQNTEFLTFTNTPTDIVLAKPNIPKIENVTYSQHYDVITFHYWLRFDDGSSGYCNALIVEEFLSAEVYDRFNKPKLPRLKVGEFDIELDDNDIVIKANEYDIEF